MVVRCRHNRITRLTDVHDLHDLQGNPWREILTADRQRIRNNRVTRRPGNRQVVSAAALVHQRLDVVGLACFERNKRRGRLVTHRLIRPQWLPAGLLRDQHAVGRIGIRAQPQLRVVVRGNRKLVVTRGWRMQESDHLNAVVVHHVASWLHVDVSALRPLKVTGVLLNSRAVREGRMALQLRNGTTAHSPVFPNRDHPDRRSRRRGTQVVDLPNRYREGRIMRCRLSRTVLEGRAHRMFGPRRDRAGIRRDRVGRTRLRHTAEVLRPRALSGRGVQLGATQRNRH